MGVAFPSKVSMRSLKIKLEIKSEIRPKPFEFFFHLKLLLPCLDEIEYPPSWGLRHPVSVTKPQSQHFFIKLLICIFVHCIQI